MSTVSILIAVITILHILGYIAFIYWTTRIKAGGDAKEGEIIDHTWDGDLKEMNNPLPGWWLSLFYLMIAFAILYLILYPGVFKGVKNWTQISQYQEESRSIDAQSAEYFRHYASKSVEELAKDPGALATGRRIFSQNCAVCHASDAGGIAGSYPNLSDNDWIWGGTPEAIINTISNGHAGAMPPGGALIPVDPTNPNRALTAEEQQKLDDVANYILALGGYSHDDAAAAKGKELYSISCIGCHGAQGEGNTIIGAPKLADQIWLYAEDDEPAALKAFLEQQILHPRNNVMPAWKDTLGDAKIKVVAAYIYSLSHGDDAETEPAATTETTAATEPVAAETAAQPASTAENTATESAAAAETAVQPAPTTENTAQPAAAPAQAAENTATESAVAAKTTAQPASTTENTATESAAAETAAQPAPATENTAQPAAAPAQAAENTATESAVAAETAAQPAPATENTAQPAAAPAQAEENTATESAVAAETATQPAPTTENTAQPAAAPAQAAENTATESAAAAETAAQPAPTTENTAQPAAAPAQAAENTATETATPAETVTQPTN